jgi:D-aminoacyl-tRNA deacylase
VRLVIQRVKEASVTVDGTIVGQINKGLLVFLGVAKGDTPQSADYLVKKLVELRVFEDSDGKMNLSAQEAQAQFLIVSQFTLLGNCDKGRRPSFDDAADPVLGEQLYKYFVEQLKKSNMTVETGRFRAMMDVSLVNDGPVTFVVDSK